MRRLALLILAAALLAGCGEADTQDAADGASPATPGVIAIGADDFGDWQEAAKQASGIDCVTPQFIFSDTGEAVRSEADEDKVTSKRQPAFQCADGLPFFWASVKADAKTAKADSDAAKVAHGFDGVKVVNPPSSAPAGASCVAYVKQRRFTCYLAYENLALMSDSDKSLGDAAATLAGGLAIVKAATD